MTIEFLDVEDVLAIHEEQIAEFGGEPGLRDRGLLESAVAQPEASFGGEYVHSDVFAMAAAYLFHIARNHPFVDGNKRTGLVAALVFLDLNGFSLIEETPSLYEFTVSIAEGKLDKPDIADRLRSLFTQRPTLT